MPNELDHAGPPFSTDENGDPAADQLGTGRALRSGRQYQCGHRPEADRDKLCRRLSVAEVACRATSVAVTLYLAQRLGTTGFGRIEFAFNVVFWLVLLVREGLDVLAAREIARHPRLVRPLVNHVLAIRGLLALTLLVGLLAAGGLTLSRPMDRLVLGLYGLMLTTTALGLDFVFRGLERMGLVAVSLHHPHVRSMPCGVALLVTGPERLVWVPVCLVTGEVLRDRPGVGLLRPSVRPAASDPCAAVGPCG